MADAMLVGHVYYRVLGLRTHGREQAADAKASSRTPRLACLTSLSGIILQADEMFASGTAVVVQPIGSVTYQGKRVQLGSNRQPPQAEANGSTHHNSQQQQQHGEAESTSSSGRASSDEGHGAASHSTCSGDALTPRNSNGISRGASEAVDSDGTASCTTPDDDVACEPPEFCSYGGVRARCLRAEQRRKLQAAAPHPAPGSLPPGVGPVAQRLYGLLTSIQYGRVADPFGWMVPVEMEGPTCEWQLRLGLGTGPWARKFGPP